MKRLKTDTLHLLGIVEDHSLIQQEFDASATCQTLLGARDSGLKPVPAARVRLTPLPWNQTVSRWERA